MEWNTGDLNGWPAKVVFGISSRIRSKKAYTQAAIDKKEHKDAERRKKRAEHYGHTRASIDSHGERQEVNELGEHEHAAFSQASTLVHEDHTDMMHRLAHHDSFDSLVDETVANDKLKDPYFDSTDPNALELTTTLAEKHAEQFRALPDDLWKLITSYLGPADTASLTFSTRILYEKFGRDPFLVLEEPEHFHLKIDFLRRLDSKLPRHLLCYPCGQYHLRLKPGKEWLKADYVNNPVFTCPKVKTTTLPRLRLTPDRALPYAYLQLALRHSNFTTVHGLDAHHLARRWKPKTSAWTHTTRYVVHDHHLLVRVVSQVFALPNADMTETRQRHLLYEPEDYTPFFSVCAHWRDGDLMRLCKCALSHIPSPRQTYAQQLKKAPHLSRTAAHPNFIVTGCDDCRPARRCPECPTEYLIEVQMVEDTHDTERPFKHALTVTRWSDLGDGSSPYTSPEFAAIKGVDAGAEGGEGYESFSHVGRRAVAGMFESRVSGSIPGQRMISLNPKNQKLGEEGHGWY